MSPPKLLSGSSRTSDDVDRRKRDACSELLRDFRKARARVLRVKEWKDQTEN